MRRTLRKALPSILIAMLVLAACGTRVDRAAFYRTHAGGGAVVTNVNAGGTSGSAKGGSTSGATTTTTTTSGGSTATGTGGRGGGSSSSGGTLSSSSGSIPANVSSAEIGKTITIGIHVPETGAAPLPTNWTDSLDVVQSYSDAHPVNGRTIRFAVEDDGYDPAQGLAACRKLAGESVLFVIGHTMPTIEDGCAGLFESRGIPYLMRGVPESYLKDRPLVYFGTTSDDIQSTLLADYALKNLGARTKPVAIVTENDQPVSKTNFRDEITKGGGKVVLVENSVPREPDFSSIIAKLQSANAQIVFLNIAPVDAIKIAVQSQGVGYHPTWVGEGTHWNYNLAMQSAGMALDGAVVFSPWPAVDSAAASAYRQAFAQYKPNATPDDIGEIIWGWAMLARAAIQGAGPHLSRRSFVESLNHLSFAPPFWQPITYTASQHRGGTEVAVFRGDGQAKKWVQISGFSGRF